MLVADRKIKTRKGREQQRRMSLVTIFGLSQSHRLSLYGLRILRLASACYAISARTAGAGGPSAKSLETSPRSPHRIFTARAARSAIVVSDIADCSIISTLAQRARIAVSVGENAVLVLNARNK